MERSEHCDGTAHERPETVCGTPLALLYNDLTSSIDICKDRRVSHAYLRIYLTAKRLERKHVSTPTRASCLSCQEPRGSFSNVLVCTAALPQPCADGLQCMYFVLCAH